MVQQRKPSGVQSLEVVVGRRLRELREQAGRTQEDTAAAVRSFGFDGFTRRTLAKLEAGDRAVHLGEMFALCGFFGVALQELVPADVVVGVGERAEVPGPALRAALRGRVPDVRGLGSTRWPLSRFKGLRLREAVAAAGHAKADATRKAAARLGVEPIDVAVAAVKAFGHSLVEERDARVESRLADLVEQELEVRQGQRQRGDEPDLGSLRALRGHVTRELLEEVRQSLGVEAPKAAKKTTSKRRKR